MHRGFDRPPSGHAGRRSGGGGRDVGGRVAELGTLAPKPLAALVGVAPFARESGTQRWVRTIAGGRAAVRKALTRPWCPPRAATPCCGRIWHQFIARGKAYKVAMVATMRRYLGILNAMLRDGLTWPQTDVSQGRFLPV